MKTCSTLVVLLLWSTGLDALDNGLARTPPMGWLSWERYECNTDCRDDPDNCIGEKLLMEMADHMASDGYKDVGYEYIVVDDCWPDDHRDAQGRLQANRINFPHGMKYVADYIHSKGLKLGVYEDVGRHTCAGAPGTEGHIALDAQTFADWGVDMIKYDGCNANIPQYDYGYPAMAKALNKTGRPILYSCEWPIYTRSRGGKPDYVKIAQTCNTFRVYGDIYDAWQSITSVLGWYGDNPGNFQAVAGPGHFCDADMITLGDYGLSHGQERVQMGMWAIIASQLLMSNDLRDVPPASKALLQNKRIIAINQDPLGIQGKRILRLHNNTLEVWTRPITPVGSFAVAYLYLRQQGAPIHAGVQLSKMGLTHPGGYAISEAFEGQAIGDFKPISTLYAHVNPTSIFMVRADIIT